MKYNILILFICLGLFSSCDKDTFSLNLQENPNELNQSSVDPNSLLNTIVFNAASTDATFSGLTESLVRLSPQ